MTHWAVRCAPIWKAAAAPCWACTQHSSHKSPLPTAHLGPPQIKPDDAFGRQMCSNLESRGCPLLGLHATPTLEAHVQRMVSNGWSTASCHDMDTIYKRWVGVCNGSRGWEGAFTPCGLAALQQACLS